MSILVQEKTYYENEENYDASKELAEDITDYLVKTGFRRGLKGFNYTRDAILIRIQDKTLNITAKECYKQVAKRYGVNYVGVERAVRYAIESAWINEFADHTKIPYCPGSAEFIAESAEIMLMRIRKNRLETYSAKNMFGRPSIFKEKQ